MWMKISKNQPEKLAAEVVKEMEKIVASYGWPTINVKYSKNLKQMINLW